MTAHQMANDSQAYYRVTRETKLTLSIALNPRSKLTLECCTNLTSRNTGACLSIHSEPEKTWQYIFDYNFG